MSQVQNEGKPEEKLPPLPENADRFWRGAEKYVFTPGKSVTCEEKHYFVRKSGTEVQCRDCPVGYMIMPGYEVKDGHIYQHGTLVI